MNEPQDELIAEEDADVSESEIDTDSTPDEEESDAVLPPAPA